MHSELAKERFGEPQYRFVPGVLLAARQLGAAHGAVSGVMFHVEQKPWSWPYAGNLEVNPVQPGAGCQIQRLPVGVAKSEVGGNLRRQNSSLVLALR